MQSPPTGKGRGAIIAVGAMEAASYLPFRAAGNRHQHDQPIDRGQMLQRIQRACERLDMTPTRFGIAALGDPQFVWDMMRRGRTPRPATMARVLAFLADLDGRA